MTEKKAPTILIVDDERALADTMAAILCRAGYKAIAAYSASEALKCLDEVSPDLLISDVMMPLMNGVEFAIEACKLNPTLRVLLMSGHAGTQEIIDAAGLCASSFELFAKPIAPRELLTKVASLVDKATAV